MEGLKGGERRREIDDMAEVLRDVHARGFKHIAEELEKTRETIGFNFGEAVNTIDERLGNIERLLTSFLEKQK